MATTALCALLVAAPAMAQQNNANIRIPLSGTNAGSVNSITILQTGGGGNTIGTGTADGTAYVFSGPWNTIAITQQGTTTPVAPAPNNSFTGSARSAAGAPGSLAAEYIGDLNVQVLSVGTRTAPTNPSITISVTGNSNTLNDLLDSTLALTLNRVVVGDSNMVTNSVLATGNVTLVDNIGGALSAPNPVNALPTSASSNNVIERNVPAVGALTSRIFIRGNSNRVTLDINAPVSDVLAQQQAWGNANELTIDIAGDGPRTVRQRVSRLVTDNGSGNPTTSGPANNNTLRSTLTAFAGAGQTLTQEVQNGGYNNNFLDATMSGSNQTVFQSVGRTEVGPSGASLPGQRASSNNRFAITTAADNGNINATWRGFQGNVNITQEATATGAIVTWTGYGSFGVGTATPAPALGAALGGPSVAGGIVNINQTGAGNVFTGETTANPGALLTVTVNQN